MRKSIILFIALALLVFVVACDSNVKYKVSNPLSHSDAINELGDVSRVFSASGSRTVYFIDEENNSRFYTGQELNMDGRKARFEADIVEYNSLEPKVLEHVECIESCNAMMHQNYAMFESGNADPNKKYVEFASYIDLETEECIMHEIRVFTGDFMDVFRTGAYYAKSASFSPDLAIDIERHVNIWTGEKAFYHVPEGPYYIPESQNDVELNEEDEQGIGDGPHYVSYKPKNLIMQEIDICKDDFNKFGEVNRVFAWYDGDEIDLIHMFGGDDVLAECYLLELNTLSDEAAAAFAKWEGRAGHQREWTIESIEGKYYVEWCEYVDSKNDTVWHEHRLRTEKMPNTTYGYYTKCTQEL